MNLLVLGGTVFLSKAIAALGVARGHDVTVAARGVSGEPPDGVRFVKVSRDSADGIAALRAGSLACATSRTGLSHRREIAALHDVHGDAEPGRRTCGIAPPRRI